MLKKIIYIISGSVDSPKTGGEFYTKMVIDYLRSKNKSIDTLTLGDVNKKNKYKNYPLINLKFAYYFLRKKNEPDIIIEDFYMHPWLFLFNWIIKIFTKKKIIVLVQSFYHFNQNNVLLNFIDKIVAIFFLRPIDIVIANSQTTAKELEYMGIKRSKIQVIYPGTDLKQVLLSDNNENYKNKKNSEKIKLLSVVNYEPRKGIHFLLEALALLKKNNLNIKKWVCEIVGNPDTNPLYTQHLKNMIINLNLKGQVELLGWKSREEVKDLFKNSDIFVFPSINEGFGMVLAEAMGYGLPIVAFRAGPIPELIDDGKNGILVEVKNVQKFAQAIERLINDDNTRKVMGEESKKRASQFLIPWERVGERFLEIIETV